MTQCREAYKPSLSRFTHRSRRERSPTMTGAEQKERAIRFLENFNHADPAVFEQLITENFTFEIVSGIKEFPPIKGRRNFATTECATLKRLFPEGLKLKLETVICEGPPVPGLSAGLTVSKNSTPHPP